MVALRFLSAPVLRRNTSPKYAALLEYDGTYGGAYLLQRGLFMSWELPRLLDGDLVREGWSTLQPILHLDEWTRRIKSPYAKVAEMELGNYMRNMLLRDADWTGMDHSLEIRVPFVDVALFRALAPYLTGGAPIGKRSLADAPSRALPGRQSSIDRKRGSPFQSASGSEPKAVLSAREGCVAGRDICTPSKSSTPRRPKVGNEYSPWCRMPTMGAEVSKVQPRPALVLVCLPGSTTGDRRAAPHAGDAEQTTTQTELDHRWARRESALSVRGLAHNGDRRKDGSGSLRSCQPAPRSLPRRPCQARPFMVWNLWHR